MVKTIIVTGIGGNVGQGILRNIRRLPYDIKIIGTNIKNFSAGNHLCDIVIKTPYAYEKSYIHEILHICKQYKIDLIIPSTDYEVYHLSQAADKLPLLSSSPHKTAEIFLNKFTTFKFFSEHSIPFANSTEPSAFKKNFTSYIVKPKEGRGSRGIHFNPEDLSQFPDEEYMLQELHVGKEITTAFYVTNQGKLNGIISLERSLKNGTTQNCRVTTEHDLAIREIIKQIMQHMVIKGSCNIQVIVDEDQNVCPFEVNGRISGTNSIRSNFGFNDVQWTIEENLYGIEPTEPVIQKGVATRILMDVIYPKKNSFVELNCHSKHYLF